MLENPHNVREALWIIECFSGIQSSRVNGCPVNREAAILSCVNTDLFLANSPLDFTDRYSSTLLYYGLSKS